MEQTIWTGNVRYGTGSNTRGIMCVPRPAMYRFRELLGITAPLVQTEHHKIVGLGSLCISVNDRGWRSPDVKLFPTSLRLTPGLHQYTVGLTEDGVVSFLFDEKQIATPPRRGQLEIWDDARLETFDPFEHILPPKKRRQSNGRGGGDRPSAPANAGKKNENTLRVFAERHVPIGQVYEHYARTVKKSKGHDAAYCDATTLKVVTPIEYKSSRSYELTPLEARVAVEYYAKGSQYLVVTPKGIEIFDPANHAPTGALKNVGALC